ncbi:MAG: DEAD/DEAH box helicase, partial [Proteobacteria bacterium]|nr:DEAD/DEAH box helicase [Pseudomonadota bacterium]
DLKISVSLSGASAKRDLDELENAATPSSSSGNIDWFDCHVVLQQNNANVPLSTLFRNVRSDEDRWVRLDSGAYAKVPGGGVRSLKTTLGLLDPNYRLSNTLKSRLTPAQALSFSASHDPSVSLSIDTRLKALSKKFADFAAIEAISPSKKFQGKLRPYQAEGVSWMNFLHEFEFGGILADEMGLGKTVQALAFFQKLKSKRTRSKAERLPALVVAPTSVMTNWYYEAKKFTPDLNVVVLHGPSRKRHLSNLSEYDLVITSYALLRMDRIDLERQQFGYVLLDEAQNIKNPDAAVTKAAKALRCHRRLALTGTPTENRPLELWSIVDFLMPGYLGSLEFFRNFIEKPILEGGPGQEVIGFLRSKTKPFILRRTKAEVERDLPPKIESVMHVEMTNSQRRLYNQIVEEVRPRVFETVDKVGIRGATVSILAALLRLRQVCNHPNSIDSLKNAPGFDSGKFNALKELVGEALDSEGKILLFAQFREMLAIIRRWLEEAGITYAYLDGETRNRQDVVDRFNTDDSVKIFLISLKAGGTGLNLASANTVIIYDPWWNPAVESQAVDRAHRIGQRRTVNVYRMVTEESIEQKIMDLKARKSKIVDALVNESAFSPRALTRADLEQLLSPLPLEGV